MILGDVRQTLADMAARIGGEAAMAHLDIGTGEKASSMALAEALAPAIAALMRPGGVWYGSAGHRTRLLEDFAGGRRRGPYSPLPLSVGRLTPPPLAMPPRSQDR